jgi:hypothetical protein
MFRDSVHPFKGDWYLKTACFYSNRVLTYSKPVHVPTAQLHNITEHKRITNIYSVV